MILAILNIVLPVCEGGVFFFFIYLFYFICFFFVVFLIYFLFIFSFINFYLFLYLPFVLFFTKEVRKRITISPYAHTLSSQRKTQEHKNKS